LPRGGFTAPGREAFDASGNKTLLEERALLKRDVALVTGFLDTMYFKPQEIHAEGSGGAESVRAGTSSDAMLVPTIGYLIVGGFFIIVPALLAKGFFMSIIALAFHLLFLSANI
jgi:hypothetical protein